MPGDLDPVGCLHRRFVLPDPQYVPAQTLENHVRVAVARLSPLDLPAPPLLIGDGAYAVLGAAVPEATVDEHRQSGAGEGDVDGPPSVRRKGQLYPVPHPATVQLVAKS